MHNHELNMQPVSLYMKLLSAKRRGTYQYCAPGIFAHVRTAQSQVDLCNWLIIPKTTPSTMQLAAADAGDDTDVLVHKAFNQRLVMWPPVLLQAQDIWNCTLSKRRTYC